ncbi:hypothetical protein PIB30_103870, partial [Stylosanthes scabra]|nr:hypothetical protein [Stylosanthes scabra]
VDRVIPQFRGVHNAPHQPVNIDFLHAKDGRGSNQWWPRKYQIWHSIWASRFAQLFEVAQPDDPGPSADVLRWWFLAGKRYLVPIGPFHQLPGDDISVNATQRQSAPHPHRTVVADVPDNRRPARRMMVGTRTTALEWQWLDQLMADDAQVAPLTQHIRRTAEGGGRRRGGRGDRGRGEGGVAGRVFQPGFQQMMDEILMPGDDFMVLGGTPPSAHVPGPSWEIPFMAPASVPTPPVSPAPAEHPDQPPACGRGRRVPRCRGCGT